MIGYRTLLIASLTAHAALAQSAAPEPAADTLFVTSDRCMACHNGLTGPAGKDVSIGAAWQGSMMANSSRDPYWQAAVRREITEHAGAAGAIEDKCSSCHMPMARFTAKAHGGTGTVFEHLPVAPARTD